MEKTDMPAAYGQHTNAEINSQITESLTLLDSILSLQPAKAAAGGKTMEEKVLEFLRNLKMPEALVVKDLKWKFRTSDDPLITVLV
jgi:dynein heavy chain